MNIGKIHISITQLITVLVVVFGIGGTWATLAGDVSTNKEDIEDLRIKDEALDDLYVQQARTETKLDALSENARDRQQAIDNKLDRLIEIMLEE